MRRIEAIAAVGLFAASAAYGSAAADEIKAITTPGKGDLTMCPYSGCNVYHHIALPPRVAVGDRVPLDFGSNEKQYDFPVARIVKQGDGCTVLSDATGDTQSMNRIEVAPCQAAAPQ